MGSTVTAPLVRYQGGRFFGGDQRDAQEAGSPGNVSITFENGLKGVVQFPGESPAVIERFTLGGTPADEGLQAVLATTGKQAMISMVNPASLRSPLGIWHSTLKKSGASYQLDLKRLRADSLRAPSVYALSYQCQATADNQWFECSRDAAKEPLGYMPRLRIRYAAGGVIGAAQMASAPDEVRVVGNVVATDTQGNECVAASGGCKDAFFPVNGTWVVADELNGKPGRGISLDVQSDIAVLQIFNYLDSGASTFHMGSGEYGQGSLEMDLSRYAGGRYLGGPAQSAHWVQSAGTVQVDFANSPTTSEGLIQFPGEPAKKIVRLGLDPQASPAEALLGHWHIRSTSPQGMTLYAEVILNKIVDGVAWANTSGDTYYCRYVSLEQKLVECTYQTRSSQPKDITSVRFFYDGYTTSSPNVYKIRDRYGNLLGL